MTVSFAPGNPFEGLNITNQYQSYGINFLDGNIVQGGRFYNPAKFDFMDNSTVCEVTIVLKDWNDHTQSHSLLAYDKYGRILDKAIVREDGLDPMPAMPMILTVKHPRISSVAVVNEPQGATELLSITYSK
ncbi:MAG: hypothetical protein M0P76_05570 [Candidatus Pacebacteria bacterium]|nr:hypothetical protein [Candidatus Paceibacterota bacterium]